MLDNQNKSTWPVVSIDTEDNDFVRFHENPAEARLTLSNLVGIYDLKPSRNFTKDYITGPRGANPTRFRKRFKLVWVKDYLVQ